MNFVDEEWCFEYHHGNENAFYVNDHERRMFLFTLPLISCFRCLRCMDCGTCSLYVQSGAHLLRIAALVVVVVVVLNHDDNDDFTRLPNACIIFTPTPPHHCFVARKALQMHTIGPGGVLGILGFGLMWTVMEHVDACHKPCNCQKDISCGTLPNPVSVECRFNALDTTSRCVRQKIQGLCYSTSNVIPTQDMTSTTSLVNNVSEHAL